MVDLLVSTLDSPYANYLTRQFVLTALTKISSRPTTTSTQQERIQTLLASYTTSPELEIQQRAVEYANLFNLGDIRSGVLERMPAPELKQTVIGVGKDLPCFPLNFPTEDVSSEREQVGWFSTAQQRGMHYPSRM